MILTKLRPILGYGLQMRPILLKKYEPYNMLAVLPVEKCNHRRTYKNFGHRKDPPEHPIKKCYLLFFIGLIIYQFVNWDQ
jgi:hypothetical protein